jgi:t-SNARE complex subunit (syntaxin)
MAGGVPTLGELGRRMNALEQELGELRELVDGQEAWSHRKRLHAVEGKIATTEMLQEALEALRAARYGRLALIAQWGSLVVAVVALAIVLHGG